MTAPALDVDALTGWLDARELGAGPVGFEFLSGGAQNHIWVVRRGDWVAVLRIPPPEAPPARDEGILREWRIIEALRGSDVPHAAAVAACDDASVLGRTFYLMAYVEGWSPMALRDRVWPEPFRSSTEERRGLAFALVDGIAAMAGFEWRERLGDLGRPDGFHERQVERWTRFHDRTRDRPLPGLDEATAWLRERRPRDFVPGLMHGDYQFANVMFAAGAPARLAAIVDWEMGTIGDPKLDLAWTTCTWPTDTSAPDELGYVDLTGMPSRGELIARFADATGRQVDDMDYYEVLAQWKLAIVLEQGFQRAAGDPKLEAFGDRVLALAHGAAEQAAGSDYR